MKKIMNQAVSTTASGFRGWLAAGALMGSLLVAPAQAQVPACIDVFPAATSPSQPPPDVLTLPSFPTPNDGALNLANNTTHTLAAGDHNFTSVNIGTGASLVINGPVRIFVRDNMIIENNASINAPGATEELVVLVHGSVSIGVGTVFNGILYAEGPVSLGNHVVVTGAITSRGTISTATGTQTHYDQAAVEAADFGGLCGQAATGPDHLRLQHGASGLTCSPETITVQACADADCTDMFADPVNVSLTSPAGNWLPNPVLIEQSGDVSLQVTSPGTVVLDAVATDPAAEQPTRCFNAGIETDCQMIWYDSGFVLVLPDHVAATTQAGTIAAVRSDDPAQACVPAFASQTRTVDFWFDYLNPTSGSQPASINGELLGTTNPGTPLELDFDANGVAALSLVYTDAGALDVHAHYEGSGDDAGLVMTGQTETIVRPSHFTLEPTGNPAATDASGPVYRRAGVMFAVTVAARNASGNITAGFGRELIPEGVLLETDLIAPAGGAEPAVVGSFNDFGLDCDGGTGIDGIACGHFTWPEVGIIELTPRLASGSYLGSADVVGLASGPIGRFIPDHFVLSDGLIRNRAALAACADPFTYVGERFDAQFTLTARNADGNLTANYHADFAHLLPTQLGNAASDAFEPIDALIDWLWGSADVVVQARMPRLAPAGPFDTYQVATNPVDSDGVAIASFDLDLSGDGEPDHALIDETVLRFGRLAVDNSIGSENGPVALPLRAEFYQGVTWVVSSADQCTSIDLVEHVVLTDEAGSSVDGSQSATVGGGAGSTAIDPGSVLVLEDGRGHFLFTAPGAPGWVDLDLVLDTDYPFLRDDLVDDGEFEDNPAARATFGLFSGDHRRILIQEVAPN